MKQKTTYLFFILLTISIVFSTCMSEKGVPEFGGFPDEVGKLIFTKCATAGCHTDQSKDAAGGLSLTSWENLFEGGRNSVSVIPFRHDFSTMFFYTNTYNDLGISLNPTMPYNRTPLDKEEVILLRDWINEGAPNRDGMVKFADNPNRKKFYVVNQGCDVVTVFDQATLLPMRYINVFSDAGIQSPHMIRVSPDNQFWYVIALGGSYLEKYSCIDDSFVSRALISTGYWNTFVISSDSQTAYCVDLSPTGAKIATVNLNTMSASIQGGFTFPHGSALNNTNDVLYVTQQTNSNKLYKIPVADFSTFTEVDLFTTPPSSFINAHEIKFSPDGSKYVITCQSAASPEVRIFQTSNDSLLAIIPVGAMPSELSFSTSTDYCFVTCTEDLVNFSGKRGSVAVINYQTNSFVKYIYTGHQPHGVEVDDSKKLIYISNRNSSSDGPAPHHTSACGGRNGNVSFIDLNTLEMVPSSNGFGIKKIEISVDPYSVAIRH
ncbi:MAG: YncE family protein [Bacteroidota bacterium]|nr:YncE family protein [Bacteroidota bacterium]